MFRYKCNILREHSTSMSGLKPIATESYYLEVTQYVVDSVVDVIYV